MKLYYKIVLKYLIRRIFNALKWSMRALYYNIEIELLGENQYSLSEKDVKIANLLLSELLDLPSKSTDSEIIELKNNEEYQKFLVKIKNSFQNKIIISTYHRINEYLSFVLKHEDIELHSKKAIEFDKNSVKINEWDEFKKVRRKIKQVAKKNLSEKKDIQTFKISISTSDLVTYISLLGSLFLIAGFFKAHLYYKQFGLDISLFFGIQDYLTTSMKTLSDLAISSIIGIVSVYFGFNANIKDPEPIKVREQKKMNVERNILIAVLILTAMSSYLITKEHQYRLYEFVYVLLILMIIPKIAFRFFQNGFKAMFILIFCGYFIGAFIVNHFESISNPNNQYSDYRIELNDKNENIKVIGINTKYIFGRDTVKNETIVMPISAMKKVKIKK